MTEVRQVCNWNSPRTCYLCAVLSESTWENFVLFKNTSCAVSPKMLDLLLVFILGKNATSCPSIFFPVCRLTFPSLTTRRPIIFATFGCLRKFIYFAFLYLSIKNPLLEKAHIIGLTLSRIPEFILFVSFYTLLKSLKFSFLSLLFLLCIRHNKVYISL